MSSSQTIESRSQRLGAARRLGVACLLATVGGCANPSHVFFYQTTVVGIDVAVSPQTKNAKVVLGYDRQTNAIVPVTQVTTEPGKTENEAMSVVGTTKITVKWFGSQKISENLATGVAAENVADHPEAMAALFTEKTGDQGKQP